MSVNRSQQYLTKSYNKENGVHKTLSIDPPRTGASDNPKALTDKATDIIRQYPAPVLISGFVLGGLIGWFASRSR